MGIIETMVCPIARRLVFAYFFQGGRASKVMRVALLVFAIFALGKALYQRQQRRQWLENHFGAKLRQLIVEEKSWVVRRIMGAGPVRERDTRVLYCTQWHTGLRGHHTRQLREATGLDLIVRKPEERPPFPTVDASVVPAISMVKNGGLIREYSIIEGRGVRSALISPVAGIKMTITANAEWTLRDSRGAKPFLAHHYTVEASDRNQIEVFGKKSALSQTVIDNIMKVVLRRPRDDFFRCEEFVTYVLTDDPERNFKPDLQTKWLYSPLKNECQAGEPICLSTNPDGPYNLPHFAIAEGNGVFYSLFGQGYLFVTTLQEMQKFYGTTHFLKMEMPR